MSEFTELVAVEGTKLRMCPLCGGVPFSMADSGVYTDIGCNECGIVVSNEQEPCDVMTIWNSRSMPPAVRAVCEEIRAVIAFAEKMGGLPVGLHHAPDWLKRIEECYE